MGKQETVGMGLGSRREDPNPGRSVQEVVAQARGQINC